MQQQQIDRMLELITTQAHQTISGVYNSHISDLALAAQLANLPNWKEVLEEMFDDFVQECHDIGAVTKENLEKEVPADFLLSARGAVSGGVDRAINDTTRHRMRLTKLIQQLRYKPDDM